MHAQWVSREPWIVLYKRSSIINVEESNQAQPSQRSLFMPKDKTWNKRKDNIKPTAFSAVLDITNKDTVQAAHRKSHLPLDSYFQPYHTWQMFKLWCCIVHFNTYCKKHIKRKRKKKRKKEEEQSKLVNFTFAHRSTYYICEGIVYFYNIHFHCQSTTHTQTYL